MNAVCNFLSKDSEYHICQENLRKLTKGTVSLSPDGNNVMEISEKISAMTGAFIQQGADFVTAQQMAWTNIYHQLQQQAAICAYMSAYKVYAIATVIVIPFVFVLKKYIMHEQK